MVAFYYLQNCTEKTVSEVHRGRTGGNLQVAAREILTKSKENIL